MENAQSVAPVEPLVGHAMPAVVRAAFVFWMNAMTTAQREIVKLRSICPHENKASSTRDDVDLGITVASLLCRDCGKWLGDK